MILCDPVRSICLFGDYDFAGLWCEHDVSGPIKRTSWLSLHVYLHVYHMGRALRPCQVRCITSMLDRPTCVLVGYPIIIEKS